MHVKKILFWVVLGTVIIGSLSLGVVKNISCSDNSLKANITLSLDTFPALEFSAGPTHFPGENFILNAKAKFSKNTPVVSEYTRSAAGDEHVILTGDQLTLS